LAERVSAETLAEWDAYERFYGPLLIQDRIDFGVARITRTLAGSGTILDHLPHWWHHAEQIEPADDMIMKMRSLSEVWKLRRMNEEVEHGRSRKRPASADRGRRDKPESLPRPGGGGDQGVQHDSRLLDQGDDKLAQ
jgi:hypothetical protein